MKIALRKLGSGILVPAGPECQGDFDRLKTGHYYNCTLTKLRNPLFHRKYFAMMRFAFDHWETDCDRRFRNFDVFRENATVLAGFYIEVIDIHGNIVPKALSISFDKMDEVDFEDLYGKTVTVILQHVLPNYTRDDMDHVVENLLRFAA